MKTRKLLIGLLLFSLASCDLILPNNSNTGSVEPSNEISSTLEESSSNSENNSLVDSSSNNNSSSGSSTSPEHSSTPEQSSTPESSTSPEDSSSPSVSTTPEISSTPEDSSSPEESSSPEHSSTPEESTTPEDSSTPEHSSTPEESTTPEDSSSPEDSSTPEDSSGSTNNMIAQKEYYKSLVDRSKINYSPDFVNDPNHNVSAIEVFELNDTHGAYYDDENIVGISRVATAIASNTTDPYGVVKIANGDMLQGTAFSNMLLGEPAIAALNEMNFDAFVIGNHEFDWGIDNLSVYKDGDLSNGELECPFLGANIKDKNGKRPSWIEPYTVVEKGNVKVGIIGLIGESLESSISQVSLNGYYFENTTSYVKEYSKILLEEEKVNILIISEHNINEYGSKTYAENVEVDCIINGHDHYREVYTVNRYDNVTVPVIRSNTKNMNIGKVTLNLNSNKDMSSYVTKHIYPEDYSENSNLKSIMDTYYAVTEAYENEVIGYNSGGLMAKQIGIDACTYIAKKYDADIAMTNTGGIRANIYQSEITNGLVYEAIPFDNELYIATVTGAELYTLTNRSGYYFNQSGLGNGTNVLLAKIDKSKTYKIVCVDYVATKTFFANYFNEAHGLIKTGDYIRDCAIEAITEKYKKN